MRALVLIIARLWRTLSLVIVTLAHLPLRKWQHEDTRAAL
jgi:hypothetical protein